MKRKNRKSSGTIHHMGSVGFECHFYASLHRSTHFFLKHLLSALPWKRFFCRANNLNEKEIKHESSVYTRNKYRNGIVNNNLFRLLILTAFIVSAPIYQCSRVLHIRTHTTFFWRKIKANKSHRLIIAAIARFLRMRARERRGEIFFLSD